MIKIKTMKPTALLISLFIIHALSAAAPRPDSSFFNGRDLDGWKGNDGYWSVKDGIIVGHSDTQVSRSEFLWSEIPVGDFHLTVDVKLTPAKRNSGIQFRSKAINDHGQARGYQADIGGGNWGKLYHEHGRKKLDWNDKAKDAVKHDEWNRHEILAVGDRIWTAVNGTLCTAIKDPAGERSGQIALQIHGGPPQTVRFRNPILTHNPKVELAGMNETQLNAQLQLIEGSPSPTEKTVATKPTPSTKATASTKPTPSTEKTPPTFPYMATSEGREGW